MRYCCRCVIPDTRPNIRLDTEGVCNACRTYESRGTIDWAARERSFRRVVERAKSHSIGYDCLIPVSGGKDSHWQVATCLEYGMRPLAVTWRPPGRTELGRRNLDNLIGLGVDHIDYTVSPRVERVFMRRALAARGSPAIPMHMALFNIPLKIAVRFRIPLVVWGENSAFEYGSVDEADEGFRLDSRWLARYGVMDGTTARDWVCEELPQGVMTPYVGPSDDELAAAGVLAMFLGYYFPWDPETSLKVAQKHGFRTREAGPKTGTYDYADIDDDFVSIHHYLKWYKFGITRAFDNLSLEIRAGRVTREQAIRLLRARGEERPVEDIQRFCAFIGIAQTRFFEIVEKFRNRDVWQMRDGKWTIPDFLIPDWNWT
ncbi:MAG: N-acetyl sugar amidotransferase [Kiritimatiellae bacterium]|nr:N-acetyl sugar amidotransferase [Kiritimatiellia bacterium]